MNINLILASTSPFRKQLLEKLGIPFNTAAPALDETPQANESPEQMVARLSLAKARAIATTHTQALIIGSDQAAVCNGKLLGKPGTHENARAQLQAMSGKRITFLTGLCLLNAHDGEYQLDVVPFHVHFRELTDTQIENYLIQEQPYQCAGSFKSEGFGIVLFKRLEGDDPNALIGLPLIRLIDMLRTAGIDPLS